MPEYAANILLAIISAIGGGTLTTFITLYFNRRKNKAETIRVSAETLSVDVQNRQAIEEFYSGLLNKREDLAEKIYQSLLELEAKLVTQQQEASKLRLRNEELVRLLLSNGIEVPKFEENGSSNNEPATT